MPTRKCAATGKNMYPGPIRAAEALGRAKARAKMFGDPEPVRYYVCPFCHGYHLTKAPLKTEVRRGS